MTHINLDAVDTHGALPETAAEVSGHTRLGFLRKGVLAGGAALSGGAILSALAPASVLAKGAPPWSFRKGDIERAGVAVAGAGAAWTGTWTAQVNRANQRPGAGASLPVDTALLSPAGPWREALILNWPDRHCCTTQPDGSAILECRPGDHPGTTGGDHVGFTLNAAAAAPVPKNILGNAPEQVRYIRVELAIPGGQDPATWFWQNQLFGIGSGGGPDLWKLNVSADGKHVQVVHNPLVGRQAVYDPRPLIGDARNQGRILGILPSADPAVGYVEIYDLAGNLLAPGRIMNATKKRPGDNLTVSVLNYRQPAARTGARVRYWPPRIDASLAAVVGA